MPLFSPYYACSATPLLLIAMQFMLLCSQHNYLSGIETNEQMYFNSNIFFAIQLLYSKKF